MDEDIDGFVERLGVPGADLRFERRRRRWSKWLEAERDHANALLSDYAVSGLNDVEEIEFQKKSLAEAEHWLEVIDETPNGTPPDGFPYEWDAPSPDTEGVTIDDLRKGILNLVELLASLDLPKSAVKMTEVYNIFEREVLEKASNERFLEQVRNAGLSEFWLDPEDPSGPLDEYTALIRRCSDLEHSENSDGWVAVAAKLEGLELQVHEFERLLLERERDLPQWRDRTLEELRKKDEPRSAVEPLEYPKQAGRNDPHANPHRRAVAKKALDDLDQELRVASSQLQPGRRRQLRELKRQILAVRKEAEFNGETHSMRSKG